MKILKRVALLPILFLLAFASVSYALNTSKVVATVTIIEKLVITLISPVNGGYYYKLKVPLNFSLNVKTSWIGYSLDDGKNKTITGNTSLTGLKDGKHSIIVYANDSYGNNASTNKVSFSYCLADINGDKKVNWSDLILVSKHMGQKCKSKNYDPAYDLNDDCTINIFDMFIVLSNFGKTCKI
jgi:hypothetical protein